MAVTRTEDNLYVADLFAGAGGFTEGFRQASFTPVAAVESNQWAAKTYAANFGDHILACPIEEVEVSRERGSIIWSGSDVDGNPREFETPEIDALIGGPPCQGFSSINRMRGLGPNDPRNKLWEHYVRVVGVLRPKVFVIENVPGFLKSKEFERLRNCVEPDYELGFRVLDAALFGVPQRRKRAFVIGSRIGSPTFPPETAERATVRDAIGDLPLEPDGKNWHLARNPLPISLERYKYVPEGGSRFDLMRSRPDLTPKCWLKQKRGLNDVFGRLWWDKPATTIRTAFFQPGTGRYLHPQAHRAITIREAARLQTFPDEFIFVGSKLQVARQIGNAVPVKLARTLAEHLSSTLLKPSNGKDGG